MSSLSSDISHHAPIFSSPLVMFVQDRDNWPRHPMCWPLSPLAHLNGGSRPSATTSSWSCWACFALPQAMNAFGNIECKPRALAAVLIALYRAYHTLGIYPDLVWTSSAQLVPPPPMETLEGPWTPPCRPWGARDSSAAPMPTLMAPQLPSQTALSRNVTSSK